MLIYPAVFKGRSNEHKPYKINRQFLGERGEGQSMRPNKAHWSLSLHPTPPSPPTFFSILNCLGCHAKAGTGQDVSCCKVTPSEENHRGKLLKTVILDAMAAKDNSDVAITATLTSSQVYRMQEANIMTLLRKSVLVIVWTHKILHFAKSKHVCLCSYPRLEPIKAETPWLISANLALLFETFQVSLTFLSWSL